MKQFATLLVMAAAILVTTNSASAADWMFKRSNYSYSPYRGQVHGPNRYARGPYYSRPRGFVVRSGYRHMHSHITVGGQSTDHLNLTESWVQFGEQF